MKEVDDEIRWAVVRAILDEFPSLRERCKEYLHGLEEKKTFKT